MFDKNKFALQHPPVWPESFSCFLQTVPHIILLFSRLRALRLTWLDSATALSNHRLVRLDAASRRLPRHFVHPLAAGQPNLPRTPLLTQWERREDKTITTKPNLTKLPPASDDMSKRFMRSLPFHGCPDKCETPDVGLQSCNGGLWLQLSSQNGAYIAITQFPETNFLVRKIPQDAGKQSTSVRDDQVFETTCRTSKRTHSFSKMRSQVGFTALRSWSCVLINGYCRSCFESSSGSCSFFKMFSLFPIHEMSVVAR